MLPTIFNCKENIKMPYFLSMIQIVTQMFILYCLCISVQIILEFIFKPFQLNSNTQIEENVCADTSQMLPKQ